MLSVEVSKRDITAVRVVDVPSQPLEAGRARLRLDMFGLSSNNVTYAAMGDGAVPYWEFFPCSKGFGRPPVWGFGTVVDSACSGVDEGKRYFGYFPLAETVDVLPAKVSARGFFDADAHRAGKPSVYNLYVDIASDAAYDPEFEPEQALWRPLYPSGWWAADFLRQGGAQVVVVSSASAKTAMSMAHQLRRSGVTGLVGLTSRKNVEYVASSGLYAQTLAYDEVETVAGKGPVTYVDFLGSEDLTSRVHRVLGESLERSVLVGATHWSAKPGGVVPLRAPLVGPEPRTLSVPHYLAERLKVDRDLATRVMQDMRNFHGASRKYVSIHRRSGVEQIVLGWEALIAGSVRPGEGMVFAF
jgi:hypothetical protein